MNVWVKKTLAVPVVTPGSSRVIVWQEITSVYVAPDPVQPFASVAVTVIGNEPDCVGVPESVPFAASVMPVGSGEAVENVSPPTPPAPVNVWLNGAFTVPAAVPGFVTVIVEVQARMK